MAYHDKSDSFDPSLRVERATAADYDELVDISNRIFSQTTDENGRVEYNHRYFQDLVPKLYRDASCSMPDHYLIRDKEGHIIAVAGAFENRVHVGKHVLRTRGIGTVGVDAAHRGEGLMKRLMWEILKDCANDGIDFSFLGGLRQRYEHFGYTTAGNCAIFTMTRNNMNYIYGKDASFGYTFTPLTAEMADVLDQIDQLHRTDLVYAERNRTRLSDILHNWNRLPLGIWHNHEFCGWCITQEDHAVIHEMTLKHDLAPACSNTGEGAIYGEVLCDFIHAFDVPVVSWNYIGLYEREKIHYLAQHAESMVLTHHEQYRMFRYAHMLQAYLSLKAQGDGLCDGTLRVEIDDDLCAQKVEICVQNGTVTVNDHFDVPPTLRVNSLQAAQLFFGVGAAMTDLSGALPPFAQQWFPLPLCHKDADGV